MNIYVGNINRSTSEEKLQNTFSTFGEVTSVKIIKDKFTGHVKGFAFIEMPNDAEATAAINALHGQELDGRTLTVNQARPQENRPARRTFGGNSNSGYSSNREGGYSSQRGDRENRGYRSSSSYSNNRDRNRNSDNNGGWNY